jgi:hypothetical protein
MPPEYRTRMIDEDESERTEDNHHLNAGTTMRRVVSESEISITSESRKNVNEYRVRKSTIIG